MNQEAAADTAASFFNHSAQYVSPLTADAEIGRLRPVENDRREDEQSSTPPSEQPSHREEASRDWERGGGEARRDEDESGGYREPREPYPSSGPEDYPSDQPREAYESAPPAEGGEPGGEQMPPAQGQSPGQGGGMGAPGRGRRRGGRGRPSPRDRRMQGRERGRDRGRNDRDRGGHYQRPAPSGGQGQAHDERDERREERYSDLPPEQRSLILQAKAEVERIRETLEAVLRDLEDVSEQLTRAEHEKDVAEAEIEQLRDQLRRLHR